MPPRNNSDVCLQESFVSDAIDSIMRSIVEENDRPLARSDPKAMNRCTAKLQSFVSEPVDHQINMHMLSWDLLMMSSPSKDNEENVIEGGGSSRRQRREGKRSWEKPQVPDKFVDLCSLGEHPNLPRKRLKSFEDTTSSFGHLDDSIPQMDRFYSKEWGYFIEARE